MNASVATLERNAAASTAVAGPVLAVKNIEVIYDHVILVLRGVSLEVPQGKIVALLGGNGARARAPRSSPSPRCLRPSAAR